MRFLVNAYTNPNTAPAEEYRMGLHDSAAGLTCLYYSSTKYHSQSATVVERSKLSTQLKSWMKSAVRISVKSRIFINFLFSENKSVD